MVSSYDFAEYTSASVRKYAIPFSPKLTELTFQSTQENQEYHSAAKSPNDGGSVLVWRGISLEKRTDLEIVPWNLTVQRYIDQIWRIMLYQPLVLQAKILGMQENARAHTEAITIKFFQYYEN